MQQELIHAPIRPRRRRSAPDLADPRLRPPRRRLLPDPHGQHRGAVRRQRRRPRAAVPAQLRAGLGHRGIRHAAARHPHPRRPRGRPRQAVRPHPGDPAPDRPRPARRGGPHGDGRGHHHARLRRAERRWRHALRRDHRRLGGAQPRLPPHAADERDQDAAADRPGRRGVLRHLRRRAGAGPRLCRGLRRPTRTPTSC